MCVCGRVHVCVCVRVCVCSRVEVEVQAGMTGAQQEIRSERPPRSRGACCVYLGSKGEGALEGR